MVMKSMYFVLGFAVVSLCFAVDISKFEISENLRFSATDTVRSFQTTSVMECAMLVMTHSYIYVGYHSQSKTCFPAKCLSTTTSSVGYSVLQMLQGSAHGFPICDCTELPQNESSGIHQIQPNNDNYTVNVSCSDGWTVIGRRFDGSVNFNRQWKDYKAGFGDALGEFWLGNDNLHQMTLNCQYQLMVEMEDINGNTSYALYSHFSVGHETSNYTLVISGYSGTAGDSMTNFDGTSMNGMQFSTLDRDNDNAPGRNCAEERMSGWWWRRCGMNNVLGLHDPGKVGEQYMIWKTWKVREALAKTLIKIKPIC